MKQVPQEDLASLSFEMALKRLQILLETLEQSSPSLDEAIKAYEEGMALIQHCQKALEEAEQKISFISQQHVNKT